jgi:glycosyltransferase involved in cell wall biosynthesis
LRTLFLTGKQVYPPRGGAALRNWYNMRVASSPADTAVVSVTRTPEPSEPGSGLALDLNFNCWDVPRLLWHVHRRLSRLTPDGHPLVVRSRTPVLRQRVERAIAGFKPDVVVFEEVWLLPYLDFVRKLGVRCVFDNHNIEADLADARLAATRGWSARFVENMRRVQAINAETELVAAADQVWVCSEDDRAGLDKRYGRTKSVFVVPNVVDLAYYETVRANAAESVTKAPVVGMVGTWGYTPNEIAALNLLRSVFPALRKRFPDARLLLVGSGPTPEMLSHSGDPGVTITGRVDDVRPYLQQTTVMCIPLTIGSGTRLKILEAFASGVPVVSSTIGAAGIEAKSGVELLLADDDAAVLDALVRVSTEPGLAKRLTNAAYDLAARGYSMERLGVTVKAALAELATGSARNNDGKSG